jgi:hypothetical protein
MRQSLFLLGTEMTIFIIYKVSQEERSIFWEDIVSVILSKKNCVCIHVSYSERFPG